MRRLPLVFLAFACLVITVACLPQGYSSSWTYADLRWLGPAEASTPATDLLAVYTHTTAFTVDIRVDLLDINPGDKYRLVLSMWDNRYFYQQPLQITLASNGAVQTSGIGNGKPVIWPRVVQDFALDTVTISLNRAFIGGRYRLNIVTYTTDPDSLADEVRDIRSDGQPPAKRAPVLVAFWNTFPAVTPAQALRRWDGAHTGPLGDRHGLKYVLDGVEQYQVPVALLDVKNPASLAALSDLGAIPQLQGLYARGLLILPDVAYSQPDSVALAFSRRAAAGFDLPDSLFVYAPASGPPPAYRAQFVSMPQAPRLASDGGTWLIPLPAADVVQATADGPDLNVRRALIAAALSPDPANLVILGGSLPDSTWGDSGMAAPTFAWLASHPWIQPLNGESLLAFPTRGTYTLPARSMPGSSFLLDALRTAPENVFTASAWQTYLSLNAPTTDARLQALRNDYLGQVDELLAAARWAEKPSDQTDCARDLNGDGQPECVLSDHNYFAIIDPDGGRLSNLFYLDGTGPHQIVAPSSQFAVGLSDPSVWHPERGEAADPNVIPGAFLDNNSWGRFSFSITGERVVFRAQGGDYAKEFFLTPDGLEVSYGGTTPIDTSIPLVVDPHRFYIGPTQYRSALASQSWTWSLVNGLSVQVRSEGATLSAQGFNSSYPFLSLPEDPNLDYPAGHYYPFPLSVVTIHGQGDLNVVIGVKSSK